MIRTLIVDDERPCCARSGRTCRPAATRSTSSTPARRAVARGTSNAHDAAIVDLGLPGIDGIEVVHGLRGWTVDPDHRALGAAPGRAEDHGARRRRRRLRHEAVQHGRAPRAAARRVAAQPSPATRCCRSSRRRTSASTSRRSVRRMPTAARSSLTPDAVASRRDPRAQPRPAGEPAPAARGGVGPELREPDQLPASVHGAAPAQVRARPGASRATSSPSRAWAFGSCRRLEMDDESPDHCVMPVEREVELEHVHGRLAEDAERAAVGVLA